MKMRRLIPLLIVGLSLSAAFLAAQEKPSISANLALTPPMGWNSWNHFAEKVTDADVRASADIIVPIASAPSGVSTPAPA